MLKERIIPVAFVCRTITIAIKKGKRSRYKEVEMFSANYIYHTIKVLMD